MQYEKRNGMYLPRSIRVQNKGYGEAGASWIRRAVKGFNAPSGSPREDIDFNNYTLRQRSRMLYMSSPIATSAIRTNRTNVVGVGLKLKSRIDRDALGLSQEQAEEWQKKTEKEFALWAEDKYACDATGMNDFYGLQQLALVSWLMSGDCIGLIKQRRSSRMCPYAIRVHLIESDRIATPTDSAGWGTSVYYTTGQNKSNGNRIYDGVEVDGQGMAVAYHVRSNYPFEIGAQKTEWTRVLARQERTGIPNVLHIMDSERPDQYRGVCYLAQVIEPMLQMRRYTEAELMAAVIESFFTAFVKTNAPTDEMPYNPVNPDEPGERKKPNEYSMGPGQVNIMEPGEDVAFAEPKHPTGSFDKFVSAVSMQVGAALEIPSDLLLKSFNASYSASRAALLEAWKAFRMRRDWLANDLCRPVYEIWMSEAVARGRITAPGFFTDPLIRAAYLGSEWLGPSQGQLDPVKEITAEILSCSEGFSTHEQSTVRLNGGSWDSNIERLQRENEKLGGKAPDPHQEEGGAGEGSGSREEETNLHDPANAAAMSAQAVRQFILAEQLRKCIGGKEDETV